MKSHVILFTVTALFLAGCGGGTSSSTPPKVEEVPIGTESAKRESKRPDPEEGEDVTAAPPTPPTAAGASGSSATADATAALDTAPTVGSKSSRGGSSKKGGKGGSLSKADCDQMTDHYIELVVTGEGAPLQGMSGKELENARNMIKQAVAQNPNFVGFKGACLRDLNKSQYTCSMNAHTAKEFQTCIQ
ncbi:MAG TPA: hypothetical protein VNO21_27400 [Polyangiaceae bacterium]|nr:hypothetical protein [Polyangiaceae bacterium]